MFVVALLHSDRQKQFKQTSQKMCDSAREFIEFVDSCPTPFQFGEYVTKVLKDEGYTETKEDEDWGEMPEKGFLLRDGRALIAWQKDTLESAIIVGTHDDSPCLKLKPNYVIQKPYPETNVLTYGGGLWATWYDRDLRLAGRVYTHDEDGNEKAINFDSKEGIATIPSSPTTEPRVKANVNVQSGLNPIIGTDPKLRLDEYIAKSCNISVGDIDSVEAAFVDAQPPSLVGTKGDFVASQRIDNLGSTFCALKAFLKSKPKNTLNVLVVFDHEEIGSATRHGAKSDLLSSFLERAVGKEELPAFVARSLVVSSDNAHAIHPNFSAKHEEMHAPKLGGGPVIKRSPGAAYATDSTSMFALKRAAGIVKVPLQDLINRNDTPSGSTIGPHVSALVGIPTVDIGQPQLAMHSVRELVAVKDIDYLIDLLECLYNNYDECRLKL